MIQQHDNTTNRIDIRRVIAEKNELMALPEAVHKILEMAGKEEIGIDVLSSVVGKDPALTGRLLKIANSSFYGLTQHVSSIQQAVMYLGITTVKCLVLSAALFDFSKISGKLDLDIKTLYGNIFTVAVASRKLAVACNYPSPEDAFTCGLLHEIGLLFYIQNYPIEYREVINRVGETGDMPAAEREYFGLDHCEAGRLIAEKWHMPTHITAAIGNHHSFGIKASEQLDDIIRLAVVLNMKLPVRLDDDVEERIAKINSICERLGLRPEQMDDIITTTTHDAIKFANVINVDVDDYETYLTSANREIFRTYLQIHRLFRERQELTRSILDEERARGIQEAKQIAISTMSHYINNASMIISGQSQVLRLLLKNKSDGEVVKSLPKALGIVDESIRKIVAVLEEISELNMLDDVAFFDKSKILNIDDRIRERIHG